MPESSQKEIARILKIIDLTFERGGWHGPTLKQALAGVNSFVASFRPGEGRHTIWELVNHITYWKFVGIRRISGKKVTIPFVEKNYPKGSYSDDSKAWRVSKNRLFSTHKKLRGLVSKLDDSVLDKKYGKYQRPLYTLVYGLVAHDLYHAGQINLLKKLAKHFKPLELNSSTRLTT